MSNFIAVSISLHWFLRYAVRQTTDRHSDTHTLTDDMVSFMLTLFLSESLKTKRDNTITKQRLFALNAVMQFRCWAKRKGEQRDINLLAGVFIVNLLFHEHGIF